MAAERKWKIGEKKSIGRNWFAFIYWPVSAVVVEKKWKLAVAKKKKSRKYKGANNFTRWSTYYSVRVCDDVVKLKNEYSREQDEIGIRNFEKKIYYLYEIYVELLLNYDWLLIASFFFCFVFHYRLVERNATMCEMKMKNDWK